MGNQKSFANFLFFMDEGNLSIALSHMESSMRMTQR